MASQRITVAKIGGVAANYTLEQFGNWSAARQADDPNMWTHEQWPAEVRMAADRFAEGLRAHALVPPVLHFVEWVDLWSMGDTFREWLAPPRGPKPFEVLTHRSDVYAYALPDGGRLLEHLAGAGLQQFAETDWYILRLREAVEAWAKLVERAALIVLRHAFDISVMDEEVVAACHMTPTWLTGYRAAFAAVTADPRYHANLDWGEARPGHPEGTVRAHITEIEANLEKLRPKLGDEDYWKLKLLVHTHDSFKAEAQEGVAITHPRSHASLARAFLASHCNDVDLLAMVQYHDEPFALYRQVKDKGKYNRDRFNVLLRSIRDWNLFLAFCIIDGCTAGKSREPLRWLFREIAGKVDARTFTATDIID